MVVLKVLVNMLWFCINWNNIIELYLLRLKYSYLYLVICGVLKERKWFWVLLWSDYCYLFNIVYIGGGVLEIELC